MATLRLKLDDTIVYEGAALSVPRVGDGVQQGDETVRVEAVVWDFTDADVVAVSLHTAKRPYTF